MPQEIKIERITCTCGEVIAGCVDGAQDSRWNEDKRGYIAQGFSVDTVHVDDFKFGKCLCKGQNTKMRFKVLPEEVTQTTLFNL